MNSSMIVTEPLGEDVWREIGWDGCETLGDEAHVYIYAQRTADGRIAIGGRGMPYRFASGIDHRGATQPGTARVAGPDPAHPASAARPDPGRARLVRRARRAPGLVRDRVARPVTGLGWAGGYTGHGVAASNLAGRTLADLVLGRDTPRTGAALGQSPGPPLGARARPLAWRPRAVRLLPARRPAGERPVTGDLPDSPGRRCHRGHALRKREAAARPVPSRRSLGRRLPTTAWPWPSALQLREHGVASVTVYPGAHRGGLAVRRAPGPDPLAGLPRVVGRVVAALAGDPDLLIPDRPGAERRRTRGAVPRSTCQAEPVHGRAAISGG